MTAPDPELARLYLDAVYEADFAPGRLTFRIGDRFEGEPFALITASNPGRSRPGPAENDAANARLRAAIEARGWRWIPGCGRNGDGSHVEESFAVFDASLADCLALADEFGQAAIVWFDGERATLAWTGERGARPSP